MSKKKRRLAVAEVIKEAKEFKDPLADLVAKAKGSPQYLRSPDVRLALAHLSENEPEKFSALLDKLRDAGVGIAALRRHLSDKDSDSKPTHADILIEVAQAAELFSDPSGESFARLPVNDHTETWPIRSSQFRNWLTGEFYRETEKGPSSEALHAAINVIHAKAKFAVGVRVRKTHVRVGEADGVIHVDLCDEKWQQIKITKRGWELISAENSPVVFRRAKGMLPLPVPQRGGSIGELKPFINYDTDDDFVLIVAWLLAGLGPAGPYPILALLGEEGTAKSTAGKVLRRLIDPHVAALRTFPRDDRDLFIAANNALVLGYDNVSHIPPWMSDAVCRIATGGGHATRELCTDKDEVLFDAMKPMLLNGIGDPLTRADLRSRCIIQVLQPIPDHRRASEQLFWERFEAKQGRILGALLDAVVRGLRDLASTTLPTLPRMADFARWATACETALWPRGTFMRAYSKSIAATVDGTIDADPVAAAVRTLIAPGSKWVGTATTLLGELQNQPGADIHSRSWPADGRGLRTRLERAASSLRRIGIEVVFSRDGHGRTRNVTLSACPDAARKPASAASARAEAVRAASNGTGPAVRP